MIVSKQIDCRFPVIRVKLAKQSIFLKCCTRFITKVDQLGKPVDDDYQYNTRVVYPKEHRTPWVDDILYFFIMDKFNTASVRTIGHWKKNTIERETYEIISND